jgi:N-acetyl-anhydromuramyl-L-alanine amidase AmpD
MMKIILFIAIMTMGALSCSTILLNRQLSFPHSSVREWKYIVIHHSGEACGSADFFDWYHKHKGWSAMAYHMVINNGCGGFDGAMETGTRWHKQLSGGHVKATQHKYNQHGIGICLVGNLEKTRPTEKQLFSLTWLTVTLMKHYGIKANDIKGHGEVPLDKNPSIIPGTKCPGKYMDMKAFRKKCYRLSTLLKNRDFTEKEFREVYYNIE